MYLFNSTSITMYLFGGVVFHPTFQKYKEFQEAQSENYSDYGAANRRNFIFRLKALNFYSTFTQIRTMTCLRSASTTKTTSSRCLTRLYSAIPGFLAKILPSFCMHVQSKIITLLLSSKILLSCDP
jgi:hypothetical protein